MAETTSPTPNEDNPAIAAWNTLTEREQQVAGMLATGMTNREIAVAVEISIKTVDTHRGHVMKKLKTKNNVDLLRFMLRNNKVTL